MRYDDPSAKALNHAAFIIETVAHLQGHEQTLLPYVKKLRAYAKKLEAAYELLQAQAGLPVDREEL